MFPSRSSFESPDLPLGFLAALFCIALAASPVLSELTFTTEPVDAPGTAFWAVDLAIDSAGVRHLAYIKQYVSEIVYGRQEPGGEWTFETVDSRQGALFYWVALALGPGGRPHIGYVVDIDWAMYAVRGDSGWVLEDPDGTNVVIGGMCDIAVRSDGTACMSFQNPLLGTNKLHYAERLPSGWLVNPMDASHSETGHFNSLALDANGDPHIAYTQNTSIIAYLHREGQIWYIGDFVAAAGPGAPVSLALDANGRPHVSFYTGSQSRTLRYASLLDEIWTVEDVDTEIDTGDRSAITIDPSGEPLIAYHENGIHSLRFASHAEAGWSTQVVDPILYDRPVAIALTPDGDPVIAYTRTDFDVWLAVGENSTGVSDDAEPGAHPGDGVLAGFWPNPFNPSGTVRLDLPLGGAVVDLDVLGVDGRRVRRLLERASLAAGSHSLEWDGSDDYARPAASGVYLVRLAWSGRVESRSVVLLR